MSKGKGAGVVLVLLLAAILIFSGGEGEEEFSFVDPETGEDGAIPQICSEPDVTLTWNDFNVEARGTDPASNLFILSPKFASTADDASVNLSPNSEFEAIAGYGSATYYGHEISFETRCTDFSLEGEDTLLALASTSPTITIVNSDRRTVNGGSSKDAIGASDAGEWEVCLDAEANKYWSEPYGACEPTVVIQFDATYFNTIDMVDGSTSSAPRKFAYFNASYDTHTAYHMGNAVDGGDVCFNLEYEANGDPTGIDAPDPKLNFYDCNTFVNSKTFEVMSGMEDDVWTIKMLAQANATIQVS